MKKLLCTAAASLVAGLVTVAPTTPADAAGTMNIRVASFNVVNVSLDRTEGNQRPWRERRDVVIRQILDENIDVLGAQELGHSKFFADRLVDGETQMADLRNGLNKAGGTYELTNPYSFNCENHLTQYKCKYKYRAASGADRILYNTSTLRKLRSGTYKYQAQGSSFTSYLPWVLLETKATGQRFMFATTHLTTSPPDIRKKQWRELISKVNALRTKFNNKPVVITGDFNTQKFSDLAADMLPAMKNNGYGDVVGQTPYSSKVTDPRAQRRVNGYVNSLNRMDRNVKNYSYWEDKTRMGNTIDYVFATNRLTVPEYKLVLNFDSDLQVNGTIPSDHNMIRATLTLG